MSIVEQLLPSVLEIIPEEERDLLPELFEKIYIAEYDENHTAYLLSYWDREVPAVAFDTNSFQFLGVVTQEWAVEKGTLL